AAHSAGRARSLINDARVEPKGAAELGVAKPVAKLEIEKEIVVGWKGRHRCPDGSDDLLLVYEPLRVGEAIRIDVHKPLVRRRRGRLARKLGGEEAVEPGPEV